MLNSIRQRYHPLWRLRKIGLFRWFQSRFDPDYRFEHDGIIEHDGIKVWGKLLRDFSVFSLTPAHEAQTLKVFKDLVKSEGIELFFDIGANYLLMPPAKNT